MPAHTYDRDPFNTPERAIRFIVEERSRNGLIAVVVGVLATIVTLAAIYLAYRNVPAPRTPANALQISVQPYH